jgi:AcrR family transcriptional regulator
LTTALFELLREHDLTEVSISELCRTAGVHRTTFYGHYADIFAFASDAFARMLDEMATLPAGGSDGDDAPEASTPEALSAAYTASVRAELVHVLEHRSAYRMMFNTRVDAGFRRELFQRTLGRASVAIRTWQKQGVCLDLDTTSAAAYIAGGMVGVLEDWANSDDSDVDVRTAEVMAVSPAWCIAATPADARQTGAR